MKVAEITPPAEGLPQIVIIGGGITGLSTAWYLERAAQAAGHAIGCTVIERDTRAGGKILTEQVGGQEGFVVEGGPDSFVAQKPWAAELARDLGIGDLIHGSTPNPRATFVLCRGRPHPLPEGTMLVVPTRLGPFLRSPLISPLGKLRAALDLVLPPRAGDADESLGDFIRRRLGRELLERLAEPLLSGIHSAESDRQSLLATFPRFRDLERRHGSLIRGMAAARRAAERSPRTGQQTPFVTLRGGIGTLVDALTSQIGSPVVTGRAVTAVERAPDTGRYRVQLDDGSALHADAVVVATPAFAAAELLAPLSPTLAEGLRGIRYVSTATVTLCVREDEIGRPIEGYGVIIPRGERRRINAVTISSRKFAGRAPEGYALVRAFVGGSRTPEALALDDAALVGLVREELGVILGITAAPRFARVYRWERGNPQYDVGHIERVEALQKLQPEGILLAGAAYGGVGIPDCVRQGRAAAEAALRHIAAPAARTGFSSRSAAGGVMSPELVAEASHSATGGAE